jgi:hypothetical protein
VEGAITACVMGVKSTCAGDTGVCKLGVGTSMMLLAAPGSALDEGTDRGADRDTDRGVDRDTDRGADRGTDRGADRGTDRGADRGTDRGSDRGADRAASNSAVAGGVRGRTACAGREDVTVRGMRANAPRGSSAQLERYVDDSACGKIDCCTCTSACTV